MRKTKRMIKTLCFSLALGIGISTQAQTGAALNFDGVNDKVVIGTSAASSLAGNNKVTVEAWVRPTTTTGLGCVVGNYNSPGNNMQFIIRRDNSSWVFWVGPGNVISYTNTPLTAGTATANVWQHVAGVYNGTVMTLYINGVVSATAATSNTFATSTNSLMIGGESSSEFFTGDIDEVRVWNIARSQADIQNSMNCEINGAAANLLANYHFNQGIAAGANAAVTTATDDSGNNNTGTLTAMTLTGATSNWVAPGGVTSGVSCNGAALNFDGVNDQINYGSSLTTSLNPLNVITVEAWVKPTSFTTSPTGNGLIVGNYNSPLNNQQFFLRRDGNKYDFAIKNGPSTIYLNSPVGTSTLNTWQHVAGVWTGTLMTVYINGVPVATATTAVGSFSLVGCTNSVVTGWENAGGGEGFTGNIDEIRIWGVARTQCEINTFMNCEIPTSATGLLANYHFNQGIASCNNVSVTTLNDASGNGFNGTLNSFALNGSTSNWITPGGVVSGYTTSLAPPSITVTANPSLAVCNGASLSLTGSGTNTYSWTSGISNGVAFTPTLSNSYTVTGTNTITTCSNNAIANVTVNTLPTVSVNSGAVCAGQSFTMSPSGASTYTFSSGSAVVTPTANASYSVIGTSSAGCVSSNTAVSSVTVNALPTVAAASSASLICAGQTATLTASGASTYTWNTSATTSIIAISPTVTTSYTVTGSGANGCSNSVVISQSVSACTGIQNNNSNISAISVYPNPSTGVFTIDLVESTNITIVDVLGKVIYTQQLQDGKHNINLSTFNNGLYILKAESNGVVKTVRIVKQ
jgi:hypothetical protein